MLKNNKAYILAETIIALAIVATAITIIYAITMNYFIKQNNNINKFNTTQGLYAAKEISKYYAKNVDTFISNLESSDYIDITNNNPTLAFDLDIRKVYFSKYDVTTLLNNESIPLLDKNDIKAKGYESNCTYRYLIIFNDDSYSSVGVNCLD